MKRCIIYARIGGPASEVNNSLMQAQLAGLRTTAKGLGLEVVAELPVFEYGTDGNRQSIKTLARDRRHGLYECVLVKNLLRLARGEAILEVGRKFASAGLSVYTPSGRAELIPPVYAFYSRYRTEAGVSFSVETTLSTRSYINLIQQAQNQGYSVSLIYFWLNSPELAIERVKQRVANGGHDVPAPIIRRRYRSGLENFFRIYMPCVDYWMLADNSCTPRVIVADAFRLGDEVHIYNQELFTKIRSYVN